MTFDLEREINHLSRKIIVLAKDKLCDDDPECFNVSSGLQKHIQSIFDDLIIGTSKILDITANTAVISSI